MGSEVNETVPGPSKLDRELRHKLFLFAGEIEEQHPLNNGSTALFWHLLDTVEKHIKE